MGLLAINAVLMLLSALVLLPIAVFCAECLAATLGRKKSMPTGDAGRPRTAVLIPAHNEQLVIEQTLHAILSVEPPTANDRVVVVADNCDDRTAELASRAGAEVVVRIDPEHHGKGYALQSGLRALRENPPQVVVVIDADCLAEPQSIDTLARLAWSTQRPVQALNRTDRHPANGPIQAVSLLANRFGNLIRPLGLSALGVPCRLAGTGMAIPWHLAESARPAGDSIVEDMQLGIDLRGKGTCRCFVPTPALPVHCRPRVGPS